MRKNISLYFHTLRHLRWEQILYRIWYALERKVFPAGKLRKPLSVPDFRPLTLVPGIPAPISLSGSEFSFIGFRHRFNGEIDWEFRDHGRLWTYNLNYFDFLHQPGTDPDRERKRMVGYSRLLTTRSTGSEPYPTSLRGINWIKFISAHSIRDGDILGSLHAQYRHLYRHPEYHLMGNHLLENGFSLLFGGLFFQEECWLKRGINIVSGELKEQILDDGGHFELSPMYHQIILCRLLDCLNLSKHNPGLPTGFGELMHRTAQKMLGWIIQMTWQDGAVPMVNDSAPGIAPDTRSLLEYASRLGIQPDHTIKPGSSGYRMYRNEHLELFVDAGAIGPDYIPGHAHADTLSFLLQVGNKPFLTETGTSTYENNAVRWIERSTRSHNTVTCYDRDQSRVWGSHRVARRARATILREDDSSIEASHDGYRHLGIIHQRSFLLSNNRVIIRDILHGKGNPTGKAWFHFAPGISPELSCRELRTDKACIRINGADEIVLKTYNFARGFHDRAEAVVAEINFQKNLSTEIIT